MNADIKREKVIQKSSFDRIFELDNGLLEYGLRCKVINTVSTGDTSGGQAVTESGTGGNMFECR